MHGEDIVILASLV